MMLGLKAMLIQHQTSQDVHWDHEMWSLCKDIGLISVFRNLRISAEHPHGMVSASHQVITLRLPLLLGGVHRRRMAVGRTLLNSSHQGRVTLR